MDGFATSGQSLEQIEGDRWDDPLADATRLVLTIHALRRTPLNAFTTEDLRIMIVQKIGLPVLVPLAVARLRGDPLAEGDFYPGDLLRAVLRVGAAFWEQHPYLRRELRGVVDGLDELPDELDEAVHAWTISSRR